jgi:hypothetical protein
MAKPRETGPKRVYKYRHFSDQSLDCLVADQLFFANPSTFNDPLDTDPGVEVDIDVAELERVLRGLVERRVTAEMTAAAKSFRTSGPKTQDHISRHAARQADIAIEEARYYATNPEYEMADPLSFLLGYEIERELLRRYDRGIVSFAERANCPLMWSHYGDQHRGMCFGYSVPNGATLEKVRYGGARTVKASLVASMLDGDVKASKHLDAAVLLKKAQDWRYEKEWRLIGERGLHDSPLELEEVVFGLRCPATASFAVVRALENRDRDVRFYEIRQQRGTFLLKKVRLDIEEALVTLPRRSLSILEAFDDLTEVEERPGH